MDATRAAAEALRRQRLSEELNALKADPAGWADYLAEAEATSVRDGIT